MWTICFGWCFGPEDLDNYMGHYIVSMMKYLLHSYWIMFALVCCLAIIGQLMHPSSWSLIYDGMTCLMPL
jgi:hypothetical protein